MDNIPVIRIEFERMRHSIMSMVSQQNLEFDQYFQEALDSYCSEESVRRLIDSETKKAIDAAMKQEIGDYFKFGQGRHTLRRAIHAKLEKDWANDDRWLGDNG
jgi:hypothetical protein